MRKITKATALTLIVAIIFTGSMITGCQQKGSIRDLSDEEIKAAAEKRKKHVNEQAGSMWAQSKLPAEETKKIKNEMREGFEKALKVWLSVSDNPNHFEKGISGKALEELKQQSANELAQGKIKVRVHSDREFEAVKVEKESGAIAYAYIDNSYYIDAKMKNKISKPLNEKKEWLIGIAKIDGTWKINTIVPLRPKMPQNEKE